MARASGLFSCYYRYMTFELVGKFVVDVDSSEDVEAAVASVKERLYTALRTYPTDGETVVGEVKDFKLAVLE